MTNFPFVNNKKPFLMNIQLFSLWVCDIGQADLENPNMPFATFQSILLRTAMVLWVKYKPITKYNF